MAGSVGRKAIDEKPIVERTSRLVDAWHRVASRFLWEHDAVEVATLCILLDSTVENALAMSTRLEASKTRKLKESLMV
jgi:hypothetical protein